MSEVLHFALGAALGIVLCNAIGYVLRYVRKIPNTLAANYRSWRRGRGRF